MYRYDPYVLQIHYNIHLMQEQQAKYLGMWTWPSSLGTNVHSLREREE